MKELIDSNKMDPNAIYEVYTYLPALNLCMPSNKDELNLCPTSNSTLLLEWQNACMIVYMSDFIYSVLLIIAE